MAAYLLLFIGALLLTLLLTPPVRALARAAGALDAPDGRRHLHSAVVPKWGGMAVFIAFYAALWAIAAVVKLPALDVASQLAAVLFFPSLLILALGIVDDRRPVRPWAKIAVQLVAGLLVYYLLGIRVETVSAPFTESSILGMLSLPATLFWIVLITNAFNVVDGMDGLATGVAFIALTCMFLVSVQIGRMEIALVAACLAGAVLGFLKYNFNPASIFLGDSGSLFLGFQLAVLSIVGSQKSSTAVAVAAPLFILALPLIETATSMIRRFVTGKSILKADAGHIHHQLIRLGFTPRRAAGILYLGSGAFGLASLFIIHNDTTVGLIALVLALVTWLAIQRLGYTEFAEINSALRRFVHQRQIIQNSIISRKLADDLGAAPSIKEAWGLLKRASRKLGFSYVELRTRQALESDPDCIDRGRYAMRLGPDDGHPEQETSFAVALTSARGALGEVIFSRSSAAAPLHSELPLLISAVAQGLPRVLEQRPSRTAPVRPPRVAPPPAAAAAPLPPTRCDACGSANLRRSRSRTALERLLKHTTQKRLYECRACSWRGWKVPMTRASEEDVLVMTCEAPNLQAIDLALARMHYQTPPDASAVSSVAFGSLTGPRRSTADRFSPRHA